MTVAELKQKLNSFPDNWKILIVLDEYREITDAYGFDEGEVGLAWEGEGIINLIKDETR